MASAVLLEFYPDLLQRGFLTACVLSLLLERPFYAQAVVVHAFNPSTRVAEAGRSL